MRTSSASLRVLAAAGLLPLLSAASSSYVIDALSFGHKGDISADGGQTIPGWTLTGSEYTPEILSDRVILTPPAPGNRRGAAICNHEVTSSEWVASLDFRASGQERGSGNLNIWLTKKPTDGASVYTVEQFDGLVVTIDQYAGTGGSIRAFLNDGSSNFRALHNLDEKAFGQCHYSYRNLGRMSKLYLEQTQNSFKVSIDGVTCIQSNMIQMPTGYYFGVSASSAEEPDSFEVAKFSVSHTEAVAREEVRREPPVPVSSGQQQQQQQQQQVVDQFHQQQTSVPSRDNTAERVDQALQNLQNTINNIYGELRLLEQRQADRQDELRRNWGNGGSSGGAAIPYEQLNGMEQRIQQIDATVQRIQRDIEGRDYQKTLNDLQRALKDTQTNLLTSLPQSVSQIVPKGPSLWMFVFVVLALQAILGVSYLVYKQRRANAPKKFL